VMMGAERSFPIARFPRSDWLRSSHPRVISAVVKHKHLGRMPYAPGQSMQGESQDAER